MIDFDLKKNYEFSIELNNYLFDFLKNKISYNISMSYFISYCSYFKISEFNHNSIHVVVPNCINSSINISCFLSKNKFDFILHLWKYTNRSEHIFKDIPFNFTDFNNLDGFLSFCYKHFCEFFNINISFTQLSIFDFI